MKAVVYNKKGLPDKLIYCDVEKPRPNDNEVLIKIHAVSANAADYRSMRMGIIPKKRIFGADIAGRVESVGKNIRQFKPGDEVIGDLSDCGFGGFAEYAVAPEKALIPKPTKVLFEIAAALPIAGITALQALRDKGNIQKGQKVLIVGSGGGVGTFAVQLAKYFGAEVAAVCSSKNVAQTSSLGADYVIDYTKEDFTKNKRCYDLIIAINGNHPLFAYKRILNPNGIYVMVGGALLQIFRSILFGWLMSFGSKKMCSLAAKSNQKDLEFIVKLVEDDKIKPIIDRRYSLDKVADCMKYLGEGHARGKVVINVE
ncbi:MAG: NAD(P)-dependent alcohol dehydrogenase [Prolixibacteraceae bacterium]|jgi:NADPH:quinone reductase-like Zn-dependent oxidoreductase|nr:NAD(P)-dependent alcohol dehydrogenase [Prolixibacteraceae bacterium]MBT6998593.1 NAD(P)-dependent alcohol dehydrogenase [Prolixibacteraceae bacterium]MBT7395946.1 NAD(P)-dependent alcohol dehydrogenase [Prolixibacteraceae bacterium]